MACRFEMHFHTAEVSPCGSVPAAQGVAAYAKAGYGGAVVTDHYAGYNFARLGGTWEEKLDAWLAGYRAAKEAGDALGFTVLLGMELRLDSPAMEGAPCNEYLVYGVTREQLLRTPELFRLTEREMAALGAENGWFIAQAHPCRPGMALCPPAYLEGVEVYNGNKRHNSHNDEAEAFRRKNGLRGVSGSDFHEWEDLARGGVVFREDIPDGAALCRALRAGTYELMQTP